jgi:iron complex transport system substrate-binding protein
MLRRTFLSMVLFCWTGAALGGAVVDSTGRSIEAPAQIARVLPAGPPGEVQPSMRSGATAASRMAAKPDLILDYGTIAPRYIELAKTMQQRTGIPTVLLDGSLVEIPRTFRLLGSILHREDRAETLARFMEALLASAKKPGAPLRIVCARGPDGLTLPVPGTDLAETFTLAGWRLVAPPGQGPSRQASLDDIRALDPDVIVFTDPAMRATLAQSDSWRSLRAVRDGRAVVAPNLPFGRLDEPPSINWLLGFAWLGGAESRTLAALFNAVIYGRVLTASQLDTLLAGVNSPQL